jgi:pimeloyl-ACP methyl ester carboxylesterase
VSPFIPPREELILPAIARSNVKRDVLKVTIAASAVGLAALAAWNSYRAYNVRRRHPPTGRFIDIDGVRLHYTERGAGSPVVLLHGNLVTSTDFERSGVLDHVARRGHRVIAIDRPGFGYSKQPRRYAWTADEQADLLKQAFHQLGLNRPVVVGHSWGTLVALALALNNPADVSGLCLVAGYYYPTLRADVAMASVGAIPIVGDLLRYTVSPLAGRSMLPLAFKQMFSPRPVPPAFEQDVAREFSLRPSQIHAESRDGASMVDAVIGMEDRYRELRMPVAIFAGENDRIVDVGRHPVRLHKEIAQSTLHMVPQAGHMVHYAVPEAIADAVRALGGQSMLLNGPAHLDDRSVAAVV